MAAQQMQMQQLELQWQQLEIVQQECAALSNSAAKNLGDVFKFSMAFQKLENTLTLELVEAVILPMRNKEGGWREDKPGSYNVAQIRNVMVSAIFKGAVPANDEILIISGRLYCEKPFFTRKLADMPEFTDLVLLPGKVLVSPNGGALVNYSATWKYKGKALRMDRTGDSAIPCRLNAGQGADAALGKAERKIKCAIYNQLTGSAFSEGELDEVVQEGIPSSGGVIVTDVTETKEERVAPVISQTATVSAAVASQRTEKPAPSGPQPWENAGAEPVPAAQAKATPTTAVATPAASQKPAATQASAKQRTVAQASQPVQQRQPAPPGQPGPQVPTATTTTNTAASDQPIANKTVTKLSPSPKFDGSGTGEVEEVTLKVAKVLGPKPPHRILMEDNLEYWTKDTEKAKAAKALCDQKVPVFVEYVVEPSGKADVKDFRIVIDLKLADFGSGVVDEAQDQGAEDQADFESGGERVVE